jgi:hypothetical protein
MIDCKVARILDDNCAYRILARHDFVLAALTNSLIPQEHHWPRGGEIDILEGANALPVINSTAWTATTNLKSPTLNTLPPNADTS